MNHIVKTIKQIKTWRHVLPGLLVLLTGKPRYLPEIEWSSKLWTHNIFRLWELVFWRRAGLRVETTVGKGGKEIYCHTFESICVNIEAIIREKIPKLSLVRVAVPVLAYNNGFSQATPSFPYLFSIAVDATASGGSGYNHTVSGSNRGIMLCTGFRETDNAGATASYNSVAMTYIIGDRSTNNTGDGTIVWAQVAPSTGTHAIAWTATEPGSGASISFTGADQVTLYGAKVGAATGSGSSSVSYNITTTRANSYTVESQWGQTTSTLSEDNGQTQWGGVAISGQRYFAGAYQAQTTVGSKTLGFSDGSQVFAYATAEVLEFMVPVTSGFFFFA